jgi:ureidoglycolate lyase
MASSKQIAVQALTPDAFSPFGWVLGRREHAEEIKGQTAMLWHEHDFDVGVGGTVEFVWTQYGRRGFVIERLEMHRLTEQAAIPIGKEPVVFVVCPPPQDPLARVVEPDLNQMAAFLLDGTKAICLKRGCWHWTFALVEPANYLLVTRRSTTIDFYGEQGLTESVVTDLSTLSDVLFTLAF